MACGECGQLRYMCAVASDGEWIFAGDEMAFMIGPLTEFTGIARWSTALNRWIVRVCDEQFFYLDGPELLMLSNIRLVHRNVGNTRE